MNTRQVISRATIDTSKARAVDMKLEVVVIPVSDVERAKHFYAGLGWRLDADFAVGDTFRVVQFTPPGSPASIHFGKGVTTAPPGSARGLFLVVSDIEAARAQLIGAGVDVGEPFHVEGPGKPPQGGLDPERRSYFSYASFSDPDGNGWLLQEVTVRFPGRGTQQHGHRDAGAAPAGSRGAPRQVRSDRSEAPLVRVVRGVLVARERGRTPKDASKDATIHMKST